MQSSNANGYNSWATKTTETLPDGSQNIVYSNYAGQTMLFVLQSGGSQWCDFYQYDDTSDDLLLHAMPSAVSGFDEQYADLLHNVNGNYQYLNDNTRADPHLHVPRADRATWPSESIQQGAAGRCRSCCGNTCTSPAARLVVLVFVVRPRPVPRPARRLPGSLPPIYFLSEEILYPVDPTAGGSSSSSSVVLVVRAAAADHHDATRTPGIRAPARCSSGPRRCR